MVPFVQAKEITIRFDPESHRYAVNDRHVPHVTGVLNDLLPCFKAGEWYLERGRAVHACAAMIAEGKEFSFDAQIEGQVSACKRWFRDLKPTVHGVEMSVASTRYQYAGTLDLCCSLVGNARLIIVDWKSSLSKSLPYQLAAYSLAYREMGKGHVSHGVGVQLNDDGTYEMTAMIDLKRYEQKWLGLLTAYHVRRECDYRPNEQVRRDSAAPGATDGH